MSVLICPIRVEVYGGAVAIEGEVALLCMFAFFENPVPLVDFEA